MSSLPKELSCSEPSCLSDSLKVCTNHLQPTKFDSRVLFFNLTNQPSLLPNSLSVLSPYYALSGRPQGGHLPSTPFRAPSHGYLPPTPFRAPSHGHLSPTPFRAPSHRHFPSMPFRAPSRRHLPPMPFRAAQRVHPAH